MAKTLRARRRPNTVSTEYQDVAKDWLRHAHDCYEETSNPVFAWEGYLSARSGKLDVPEWVLEYFDRVACRLANMSRQEQPPPEESRRFIPADDPAWFIKPNKGQIAPAVYRALEFPSRGKKMGMKNPFGDIVKTAHGVSIACLVYEEHTRNWDAQRKIQNHDWGTIFADVAASHNQARPRCTACKKISKATVKALWYQHALAVIPAHLQAKSKSKKVDDILR